MKNQIISALIALCWMTPLLGLTARNSTVKDTRLVLSSANQKEQFGTATIATRKDAKIKIPANLSELHAFVGSLVPARKQMTTIEPYKDSRGWLLVGKDAAHNDILVRLLPSSEKEIIPDNAKSSYARIDGNITRVDAFPETLNEADTHRQIFYPASYTKTIDQNSYLFITEPVTAKPHLTMRVYDPKVVRKAAAAMRGKKVS